MKIHFALAVLLLGSTAMADVFPTYQFNCTYSVGPVGSHPAQNFKIQLSTEYPPCPPGDSTPCIAKGSTVFSMASVSSTDTTTGQFTLQVLSRSRSDNQLTQMVLYGYRLRLSQLDASGNETLFVAAQAQGDVSQQNDLSVPVTVYGKLNGQIVRTTCQPLLRK